MIPIISKEEFKNLKQHKKYKYVEGDLPDDICGSKFIYNSTIFGLEYRDGCFHPFLEILQTNTQHISRGRICMGIFEQ